MRPDRGRNAQLVRQWAMLLRLERSRVGITVHELAEEHRVHARTVARDLEALQAGGFPLVEHDGRWRVDLPAIERLAAARLAPHHHSRLDAGASGTANTIAR